MTIERHGLAGHSMSDWRLILALIITAGICGILLCADFFNATVGYRDGSGRWNPMQAPAWQSPVMRLRWLRDCGGLGS
jgi:hypothetical protein